MFAFRSVAIGPFWLRYSKFHIWPWKFKVKVMAKVKPDGHIWAPEFNRYVCFSFHGNRTIFGWDIANSIFDLEKSRSRSQPKSNQVIYRSGPTIMPKIKEILKVVLKLSHGQEAAAAAYEPVQKHKVTSGIPGWLNDGIVIIVPLGTNFNEILIDIHTFSFQKMHLKMWSGKWQPFCLGLNVLSHCGLALPN